MRFPAFIVADPKAKKYIDRVRDWFADLNIMLVDDRDVPVATGAGRAGQVERRAG